MIHVHIYQSRVPKEVEEEYQIHFFWKAPRPRFLQTGKVFSATVKTSLLSWNWCIANGKRLNMLIRSKVGKSILQFTLPTMPIKWRGLVITNGPQHILDCHRYKKKQTQKWFLTAIIKLLHILYNLVLSLDHQTLLSLSLSYTMYETLPSNYF